MLETWPREVDWEEVHRLYVPPSELRAPVPRRVVRRDGTNTGCRARIGNSCLGCALLPIFLIGFMLVLWAGLAALILPFGAPATGKVSGREPFSGKRDATYNLKFRFRAGRGEYSGEWLVRPDFWKRVRVGDAVKVRYFPFAPGLRPMLEAGLSPWTAILGWGPFGFLFMGISGLPLAGLLSLQRGKKWVKRGIVTPAFVVARNEKNKTLTFLVCDEKGRTVEVQTRRADIARHFVGQTETALYFRGKPESARLYRCLDWRGAPSGRVTLRP